MFKKFHIQMTFFASLIAGITLLFMTGICLFISEKSTTENDWIRFQNNAISCISHLETQSVITQAWISQVKSAYNLVMEINDNGKPLYIQELQDPPVDRVLITQAQEICTDSFGLDLSNIKISQKLTQQVFFRMEDPLEDYYIAAAVIPKKQGVMTVLIFYSLEMLQHQITMQRIAFFMSAGVALLALIIFSWFFVGHMIAPLEKSKRAQTEFIAAASHELRSPLAVILSDLSAMRQASSEEKIHFLSVIEKEGQRMSLLINDMLALSNADNHSWKMQFTSCEIDTLLLDTYEKYEPLMKEHHLHFQIKLPEEEISACICDPARISQVLGILLDNAISYVPAHGNIKLCLKQNKQNIVIFVSDNGPGIPDSMKEEVFRRFYRGDPSRNDRQHFGLGLCIASEIIQLHQGSIHICDAPDGGTTFIISFPANL